MFRFGFSEFNSFLDACEKAYQAVDERCIDCEDAIARMYASCFSGLTATAADIKFFSWYKKALDNSLAIALMHTLGIQILQDASTLKNASERIATAVGAPSKSLLEWTTSEVYADGSAASLAQRAKGICDIELSDMEATLQEISGAIFTLRGTAGIQGAVDSLRLSLAEEKEKLGSLKRSTKVFTDVVADFEGRYTSMSRDAEAGLFSGDPEFIDALVGVVVFPTGQGLAKPLSGQMRPWLLRGYNTEIQNVLSEAGIIRQGSVSYNGRYANISGYRLASGERFPTRILRNGTTSQSGQAALRIAELGSDGARVARTMSGMIRGGGVALGAANVGLAAYDGYNRVPNASDSERAIHAATEGTIAAAGIGASVLAGIGAAALTGAIVGSAVPGVGTAVGIIVGLAWGIGTVILIETTAENGMTHMQNIDAAAYGLWTSYGEIVGNSYGYSYYRLS